MAHGYLRMVSKLLQKVITKNIQEFCWTFHSVSNNVKVCLELMVGWEKAE